MTTAELIVILFLAVCTVIYLIARPTAADNKGLLELINAGATVIDVRTKAEFHSGHVRDAIHIPLADLDSAIPTLRAVNNRVLVYCASGSRSRAAAQRLRRAGIDAINAGALARWPRPEDVV